MGLIKTLLVTYRDGHVSQSQLEAIQTKRLHKLVKYAKQNSPYFKNLYADLKPHFQLHDLTPTNKADLMAQFDQWVSDPQLNLKAINKHTEDLDNVGRLLNKKYLIFQTSGSTGHPATIVYDKQMIDVAASVAALRSFAYKSDLKAFRNADNKTAGLFASDGFYLAASMSRHWSLKQPYRKNKITLDVNEEVQVIVEKLNAFQPALLSGYPSNLTLLADNKQLDIQPVLVMTGGERLTDDVRALLKKRFNTHVQTHYSCSEVGEIACECEHGNLHINEDWVIVEAVDKDNQPVDYGVQSDKVLVTNLANYVQPIIRFELTDRIIVHPPTCKCGANTHTLEIEGRSDDFLVFKDNTKIAPLSIYKELISIPNLIRFQIVQTTINQLEVRVETVDTTTVFALIKVKLEQLLKQNNIVDIDIILSKLKPQTHPISGKFQHIIKNISNDEIDNHE